MGDVRTQMGASATAQALMSAAGGTTVTLRWAQPASGDGVNAAGFGLAAAAWQETELTPVLVTRNSEEQRELLVPAAKLESVLGVKLDEAKDLLMKTARIAIEGTEFRIVRCAYESVCGAAYLYRIGLEE